MTFVASLIGAALGVAAIHPEPPHDEHHHQAAMQAEAEALGAAATAFLETLDDVQREAVTFALDDSEAREGWHFLPTIMVPRTGLHIATLSDEQRIAAHGLLARALSSEGYGEVVSIMALEDVLKAQVIAQIEALGDNLTEEQRAQAPAFIETRDSENYFIRMFGVPGSDAWAFTFDGHHLAINATVVEGRLAYSPVFLGSSPQTRQTGRYAGWRTLQHELNVVEDLMVSLGDDQTQSLIVSDDFETAEFSGTDWVPDFDADPLGLQATALNDEQRRRLWRAIDEFLGAAAPGAAAAHKAAIEAEGLESLHMAFWGNYQDLSQRFMLRIASPVVHIDFAREGNAQTGASNHVHIIVRDPSNDLGARWLEEHYNQTHRD